MNKGYGLSSFYEMLSRKYNYLFIYQESKQLPHNRGLVELRFCVIYLLNICHCRNKFKDGGFHLGWVVFSLVGQVLAQDK